MSKFTLSPISLIHSNHQLPRTTAIHITPTPIPIIHHSSLYPIDPVIRSQWLYAITCSRIHNLAFIVWCFFFFIYVNTLDQVASLTGFICILNINLFFTICELTKVDRTLLWILIQRFEFYYLVINMSTYTCAGIWSKIDLSPIYSSACSFNGFVIVNLWIISLDSAPNFSVKIKGMLLFLLVLNATRVFVSNAFLESTYNEHEFCFGFNCIGSRTLAFQSLLSLTLFYMKYVYHFWKYRSEINVYFMLLKIPLQYELLSTHDTMSSTISKYELRHASIVHTYRQNTNGISSLIHESRRIIRITPYIQHAKLTPNSGDVWPKDILFYPVNPVAWMCRFARSRWYRYGIFPTFPVSIALVSVLFIVPDMIGLSVTIFYILIMTVLEFTRVDRTLFRTLIRTFEFWFLMGNLVIYIASSCYAQLGTINSPMQMTSALISFSMVSFWIFVLDCSPSLPRFVKIGGLIVYLLNSARIFITHWWFHTVYVRHTYYILFPTDTQKTSLACLMTISLFCAKHLFTSLIQPGRFVMLNVVVGPKHEGETSFECGVPVRSNYLNTSYIHRTATPISRAVTPNIVRSDTVKDLNVNVASLSIHQPNKVVSNESIELTEHKTQN